MNVQFNKLHLKLETVFCLVELFRKGTAMELLSEVVPAIRVVVFHIRVTMLSFTVAVNVRVNQ
jgi:hypothetical protein